MPPPYLAAMDSVSLSSNLVGITVFHMHRNFYNEDLRPFLSRLALPGVVLSECFALIRSRAIIVKFESRNAAIQAWEPLQAGIVKEGLSIQPSMAWTSKPKGGNMGQEERRADKEANTELGSDWKQKNWSTHRYESYRPRRNESMHNGELKREQKRWDVGVDNVSETQRQQRADLQTSDSTPSRPAGSSESERDVKRTRGYESYRSLHSEGTYNDELHREERDQKANTQKSSSTPAGHGDSCITEKNDQTPTAKLEKSYEATPASETFPVKLGFDVLFPPGLMALESKLHKFRMQYTEAAELCADALSQLTTAQAALASQDKTLSSIRRRTMEREIANLQQTIEECDATREALGKRIEMWVSWAEDEEKEDETKGEVQKYHEEEKNAEVGKNSTEASNEKTGETSEMKTGVGDARVASEMKKSNAKRGHDFIKLEEDGQDWEMAKRQRSIQYYN